MLLLACAARGPIETGQASWYGPGFAGKPTASGEAFRTWKRTCAHKTLPFGTVLRVTRTDTGDSVRCVVNDRGPFIAGRIVDLSKKSGRRIDMLDDGTAPVELRVVGCKKRYGRCGE